MKFNDLIRVAIVLATLGYLFGGEDGGRKPRPEPVPCVVVEPYTGPMTGLHQTSRSMEEQDRIWLSPMRSPLAGTMVAADSRGLIADTEKSTVNGRWHLVLRLTTASLSHRQSIPHWQTPLRPNWLSVLGDDIRAPMSAADRSKLSELV